MWKSESDTNYVTWMKKKGAITEATFSWYMTGLSGTSYIDFGTPDPSIVGDGSNVLWIPAKENSSWWSNDVTGMIWGENSATPG